MGPYTVYGPTAVDLVARDGAQEQSLSRVPLLTALLSLARSRSRSPETERSRRLPAELRRHLQFELIDPPSVSAADPIPYTRVETDARMPRIKYAAKRQQKDE